MKYRLNEPTVGTLESNAIDRVIEHTWLGAHGPETREFEKEFAEYHGCKYGLAVQSGTAAIHTAVWASLYEKRKLQRPVVACTDYTCSASAAAISMAGDRVCLVDVEPDTYGMSYEALCLAHAQFEVDAVILVHVYGIPARDTMLIKEFCEDNSIILIEDACEAHGSDIGGQKIGSLGDIAVFSLRSEKIIGVGEGGVVVTNNEELMKRCIYFANRCKPDDDDWTRKYYTDDIGYNYSLPNVLGAIGLVQLTRLPSLVKRRRRIAALYRDSMPWLQWQENLPGSSNWLNNARFPVLSGPGWTQETDVSIHPLVKAIGNALFAEGVEVRPGFYPMHLQAAFSDAMILETGAMWESQKIALSSLCLPSHPGLDDDDILDICRLVEQIWNDANS